MPAIQAPNVKLLAVCSTSKEILCAIDHSKEARQQKQDHRNMLAQVLGSDNFDVEAVPLARRTLTGDGFKLHFMCDKKRRVFVCIASSEYPTRLVFGMLKELEETVFGSFTDEQLGLEGKDLGSKGKTILQKIAKQYEDPGKADSLARVKKQVVDVTQTVNNAMQTVAANTVILQGIETKAEDLNTASNKFRRQGANMRHKMWWKKVTMYIVCALVSLLVVTGIIVLLYFELRDPSTPPPARAPTPTLAPPTTPSSRYLRGSDA